MIDPPMRLERKFIGTAIGGISDDGLFGGYASLFDRIDMSRDVILRGAFRRTLAARGASGIRMLFQHDPAEPIGTWMAIEEDAFGLKVRGRLSAGSARAREVLALIRDGALDGLSIGFKTGRARTDPRSGIRRIHEVDLWEISVVTFPMQEGARITAAKGAAVGASMEDQLARQIRRASQSFNERTTRR